MTVGGFITKNNSDVCYAATKLAYKISKDMESYSKIISSQNEENVAKFSQDEIILGRLLGSGGYNDVYELESLDLINYSEERRNRIAEKTPQGKYAIKFLRGNLIDDGKAYCNGAADLVVETKLLANLQPHRNIVQLHGISASGISGFATGDEGGYFLILDRLSDTLENRINNTWRKLQAGLVERLQVATDISSALTHLHKHNIVYRDLKPDNVGFDVNGVVKLFDLGLAKELDERQRVVTNPNGCDKKNTTTNTYKMSGQTGSCRYMAPEVALKQPYNLSVDVYSFGILLWQILTLQEPYVQEHVKTTRQYHDFVCIKGIRPDVNFNPKWSKQLRNIMNWSWFHQPQSRPPMKEVCRALKKEVTKLSSLQAQQSQSQKPQEQSQSSHQYQLQSKFQLVGSKNNENNKHHQQQNNINLSNMMLTATSSVITKKNKNKKNPFSLPTKNKTGNNSPLSSLLQDALVEAEDEKGLTRRTSSSLPQPMITS